MLTKLYTLIISSLLYIGHKFCIYFKTIYNSIYGISHLLLPHAWTLSLTWSLSRIGDNGNVFCFFTSLIMLYFSHLLILWIMVVDRGRLKGKMTTEQGLLYIASDSPFCWISFVIKKYPNICFLLRNTPVSSWYAVLHRL